MPGDISRGDIPGDCAVTTTVDGPTEVESVETAEAVDAMVVLREGEILLRTVATGAVAGAADTITVVPGALILY